MKCSSTGSRDQAPISLVGMIVPLLIEQLLQAVNIDHVDADVSCHSPIIQDFSQQDLSFGIFCYNEVTNAGSFPVTHDILADMCVWLHTKWKEAEGV